MHRALLLTIVAFVWVGCVDTREAFDSFNERLADKKARDEAKLRGMTDIPEGGCAALTPEQLTGRFLFALTASPAPEKPLLALLTVDAKATGSGLAATLLFEPLSAADPTQTVGARNEGELLIDGTELSVTAFYVELPGAANTVLAGADAAAVLNFMGLLCVAADARVDTLCGSVTGELTEPLQVSMDGSLFGARRIVDGEPWPEPMASCTTEEAAL